MDEVSVEDIEAVREQIRPLLIGKSLLLQGAVLADLTAIWIAGHPPEMRETIFNMQNDTIRELIPVNVRMLIDTLGLDPRWATGETKQ